jgi:hypothetical protein
MVGNKRLFLGRFDGRVELKVYQSTGSHAQQCISPNMIDLQNFLSQTPDLLMKGVEKESRSAGSKNPAVFAEQNEIKVSCRFTFMPECQI